MTDQSGDGLVGATFLCAGGQNEIAKCDSFVVACFTDTSFLRITQI